MKMEEETHILEIHLISAQGLKAPPANLRRMQTYALAWVDSSAKLRTATDRFGGENPTWNDKFLFRISPDFITSETSGVSFEIYAIACFKDILIGSVRFLLSNCPSSVKASVGTPAFTAVHIQRPSGRFQGVLNIGAAVYKATKFDRAMINGASAIAFRDLMGKKENLLHRNRRLSDVGWMPRQNSSNGRSRSRVSSSSSSSNNSSKGTYSNNSSSAAAPAPIPVDKSAAKVNNMLRIAEWAETSRKTSDGSAQLVPPLSIIAQRPK